MIVMIFLGLTCRELLKSSTSESVQNKRESFLQITFMWHGLVKDVEDMNSQYVDTFAIV